VLAAVGLAPGFSAQVSQPPFELTVRHPASLVRILGASFLVHELWIVNRGSTPATLTSVMVLDGVRTIVRYADDDLRAHVGRPDLPRNHPTPLVLAPEHAAIVYFWSALPGTPTTADQITHRVALSSGQPTDSQDVVEGGASTITPLADAVVIDPPLRGAGWAAVYEPAMIGGHRTAVYTIDGVARIPGRFAIDFMRVLTAGRAHTDAANRPDDWNGFGAEVLAVADARVADAVDGRSDTDRSGKPREAITRDNAAGNYVALDLGGGRFAFYEHLQQGSVAVKTGDRVRRGQVIARVGSSGSVSSGPHLHFHVSNAPSLLGAEGLPFVLRDFQTRGAFASIQAFVKGERFVERDPGVEARRALERPAPNAVVDFPEQQPR
jgi:murein DD-endopeptidase MepM/ murein hydrolase activator NlpD